jgi:hypothetical protein
MEKSIPPCEDTLDVNRFTVTEYQSAIDVLKGWHPRTFPIRYSIPHIGLYVTLKDDKDIAVLTRRLEKKVLDYRQTVASKKMSFFKELILACAINVPLASLVVSVMVWASLKGSISQSVAVIGTLLAGGVTGLFAVWLYSVIASRKGKRSNHEFREHTD